MGHMGDCTCEQVLKKTQSVVVGGRFVFKSADGMITLDNWSWISIHVYVM
jgi:hypothetical protein